MLQKGVALPNLRRADELLAARKDLAAGGDCETGGRTAGWPDSLPRAKRGGRREAGVYSECSQSSRQPGVDLTVCASERAEHDDRCGDGVGHLMLVPHRLAAGRTAHDWNTLERDGLIPAYR